MRLDGKKTYITAVVMALVSFALGMEWLTSAQYQLIIGLLGSLGLATLRNGVTKSSTDTAIAIKDKISPGPFPGIEAGEPTEKL